MPIQAKKTLIRENIEWIGIRWHNAPDTQKPRVLLVGDSIVVGHGTKVHELLKDSICVDYFATAKNITDIDYMSELEFMLSKRKYTLIIFNNGLHGFDIDDSLYAPALQEAFSSLKEKTDGLAWRTSTPILDKEKPGQLDPKRAPRVIRRNKDALALASEFSLPVLDLYTPMAENKQYFSGDAIHYTSEGQDIQAEIIAGFIRSQLNI
jgi:hypothetical protein